ATLAKAGKRYVYQTESLSARLSEPLSPTRDYEGTRSPADWLDYEKRKMGSPRERAHEHHDAGVGFAYAKGDAKMYQAMGNLGHGTVAGVWAYQGSKPFAYRNRLFSAMGDVVQCVEPGREEVVWKTPVVSKEKGGAADGEMLDSVLTPPALVNDKAFVGTTFGEVLCLSASSGELLWKASVGEPVVFQPAVANG